MVHIQLKELCADALKNVLSEKKAFLMYLQINYCKGMSPTCVFNLTTVDRFIT